MSEDGPLRILMIEDSAADAELVVRALRSAGLAFEHRRATTREEFLRELGEARPGAILADYSVPGFDALAALALARKLGPAVPFIVVTGRNDEQIAVACMKAGADDFVLKDHLVRLPAALRAALESRQARSERRRAEEAYRSLAENSLQGLAIFQDNRMVYINATFAGMLGYEVEELLGAEFEKYHVIVHPEDHDLVWGRHRERAAGKLVPPHYEFRALHRDGHVMWFDLYATNVLIDGRPAVQAAVVDVTERHRTEEALRESETRFRALFESMEEGVAMHQLVLDAGGRPVDYRIVDVNPAYERILGIPRARAAGALGSALYGTQPAPYLAEFGGVALSGEPLLLTTHFAPMGKTFRISICSPGPRQFATVFQDVTGTPLDTAPRG